MYCYSLGGGKRFDTFHWLNTCIDFSLPSFLVKIVKNKEASTMPSDSFRYATCFTFNNFIHAFDDQLRHLVANFNANIVTIQFVSSSYRCTRANKTVKNVITFVTRNLNNTFQQLFWLWRLKDIFFIWEQGH